MTTVSLSHHKPLHTTAPTDNAAPSIDVPAGPETFRFDGLSRTGTPMGGIVATADLPHWVEHRFRAGTRSLHVWHYTGVHDELAGTIEPAAGTGRRTWWAQ